MAYATLSNLKVQSLDQLASDTTHDTALTARLVQAEAMVNEYIGIPTSLTLATSGTQTIYGDGTRILTLPTHTAGSVSLVTTLDGYTVPSYVEVDGHLALANDDGVMLNPGHYGLSSYDDYYTYAYSGWTRNVPYTVTAAWGVSADTLAICTAVTLDLAVQLWRYRDAGGSETVGAEGALLTVRSGLTALHKMDLDSVKRRISQSLGVY